MQKTKLTMLALMLCLLLACESKEPPEPIRLAAIGKVQAEVQRSGDAEAGYRALVNNAYISCGMPFSAYRQIAEQPKPDYLLPGRAGRNQSLPYLLTAFTADDGVELVSSNCLHCHAGFFDGQLIVGLGNEFLDFTDDPVDYAERLGQYVDTEPEARHWRKWADRLTAVAPYIATDTVGVNPAVNLTHILMAHRDPKTLVWSERPLIQPPPVKPLPVSVPPWWRMQKKQAMFYNGEGRGDHARVMMLASLLCTGSIEEAETIDRSAPDIRAYLASLVAPVYPYTIDQGLAARGGQVFQRNCSRCHGSYGEDGEYPNLLISLDQVGTDPALAEQLAGPDGERFIRWFTHSYFGAIARAEPALGYFAPPLDGIWATAPFLHNGSVPTIAALLNSPTRPRYWLSAEAPTDFDEKSLGWPVSALDYGKQGAKNPVEYRRIYDTTLKGYSNAGHLYGDHLSNDDRTAVIEYLKTL